MTLWILSFATESGSLGGALVRGETGLQAWALATVLQINPGGEVQMIGPWGDDDWPPELVERLLPPAQFEALPEPGRWKHDRSRGSSLDACGHGFDWCDICGWCSCGECFKDDADPSWMGES